MSGVRKPGGRRRSKGGGKPAPAGRTLESCGPAPAGHRTESCGPAPAGHRTESCGPAPAGHRTESCGPAPAGRPKKAPRRPWSLYVAECSDGSLYVGIAKDVEKRLAAHNSGRGAKYTSTRRPVRLVHSEFCGDVGAALRREREIKRWSRPKKIQMLGLEGPARLGVARRRRRRRMSA